MSRAERLSHRREVEALARALRPPAAARREAALAQVLTDDGRIRAERLVGWVSPHAVPLDAMERGTVVDLDLPAIAAGAVATLAVAVDGAREGDAVLLGPPSDLEAGLIPVGLVTAADTVTLRVYNASAAALNPAPNAWRIVLTR